MTITLDSTKVVLLRMPRSKKRRIRRKWVRRRENWGPDDRLWATYLMLGANAGARCYSGVSTPNTWEPKYDVDGKRIPDGYAMHPDRWRELIAEHPEYADKFEVMDGDASWGGPRQLMPWERRWK